MDDMNTSRLEPLLGGPIPVRLLGRGAIGEVWLAHDTAGREVALKRIPIDHHQSRSRHERELAALQLLANQLDEQSSLVHIFHVGITDDELWYTMELADLVGESADVLTLEKAIASAVRFSASNALDVVEHLLEGVCGLHGAGVVHRDIKPTNILSVNGEWKLGDIGLLAEERTEMTAVGTPDFIPPWGPIDRRADLYAMGRVLYCMVTGLPARSFPTLPDELLIPERQYETKLLNGLIVRACDPDPDQRFQTTEEFISEVRVTRNKIELGERLWTRRRAIIAGGSLIVTAAAAPVIWPRIRRLLQGSPEWISLFDGRSLEGWYMPSPKEHGPWLVQDGQLVAQRNSHFKSFHTRQKYSFGRFRVRVTPSHDRARIGITYGHPGGSQFLFYEDKYVWIGSGKGPDLPEEAGRWRSFPGPMMPSAGQYITMEVEMSSMKSRLFVNGELLQEVDGVSDGRELGLHVWGGDGGRFQDIEYQSLT